jgi:fatty acid elongase 3
MGRRDVWWRRYLTSIQIVQFVIDIVTSLFFPYFYFMGIPCKGKMEVWLVANFTGFSFFLLFLDFYYNAYSKPQRPPKKQD